MAFPFAFGVPGVAWHQKDGDSKKEELEKKAIGQRLEPSLSGRREVFSWLPCIWTPALGWALVTPQTLTGSLEVLKIGSLFMVASQNCSTVY